MLSLRLSNAVRRASAKALVISLFALNTAPATIVSDPCDETNAIPQFKIPRSVSRHSKRGAPACGELLAPHHFWHEAYDTSRADFAVNVPNIDVICEPSRFLSLNLNTSSTTFDAGHLVAKVSANSFVVPFYLRNSTFFLDSSHNAAFHFSFTNSTVISVNYENTTPFVSSATISLTGRAVTHGALTSTRTSNGRDAIAANSLPTATFFNQNTLCCNKISLSTVCALTPQTTRKGTAYADTSNLSIPAGSLASVANCALPALISLTEEIL